MRVASGKWLGASRTSYNAGSYYVSPIPTMPVAGRHRHSGPDAPRAGEKGLDICSEWGHT
jgi:hypothetical protein